MSLPVTVCIPVRDEEANLGGCLAALGGVFPDVVVVDSGSRDGTVGIARERGAKVLEFSWDGRFPKKRNWVVRTYEFRTPWVLFLDADERVTGAFLQELGETLARTAHVGFWISFTNWFLDRPLRRGDVFRKLALFRVGAGEYERFPEEFWSDLDMEVHEHPILSGTVGSISARLEHRDFRGLDHWRAKHVEYAKWEVRRYFWLREAGEAEWGKLTERQKFKYRNLASWWLGPFYFLVAYVVKRGFLDGRAGWVFNRMKAEYFRDVRQRILGVRS